MNFPSLRIYYLLGAEIHNLFIPEKLEDAENSFRVVLLWDVFVPRICIYYTYFTNSIFKCFDSNFIEYF